MIEQINSILELFPGGDFSTVWQVYETIEFIKEALLWSMML